MIKCSLLFLSLLFTASLTIAQNVGIGTVSPAASAQLEVNSNNKGILIPRLTKTQKNTIASPATGLLVYQTGPDSAGFHYYDGTQWKWIPSSADTDTLAWRTGGNTGTNAVLHFMGTRDNRPLTFRINNQGAGIIDTSGSLAFGRGALRNNPSGKKNTAFGDSALYKNGNGATLPIHAVNNTAVGALALKENTTGYSNTAAGSMALSANTTGLYNTALGDISLKDNNTGNGNTAIGSNTLTHNKANGNTAVGADVLYNNITGLYNVAVGPGSLAANESGNENIAVGAGALSGNLDGNDNIAIGNSALEANESGHNNIAIGKNALLYNARDKLLAIGDSALFYNSLTASLPVDGTGNIGIGFKNLFNNTTGYNNISIGQEALLKNTSGSRNIAMGNAALYNSNTKSGLVAVGDSALFSNGTGAASSFFGIFNTAVGDRSLFSNSTGAQNTALGALALNKNISANDNTGIGYKALEKVTTSFNTGLGSEAGSNTTTGTYMTAIGYNALVNNTTGSALTAVGYNAGSTNTTGSLNTALGSLAGFGAGNLTNATAIGANALVTTSNSLVLGNNARVGIGISSPGSALTVMKLPGSVATATFVGTSGISSFNDGSSEDTYLRGGLNNSRVVVNDLSSGDILLGSGTSKVGINTFIPLAALHVNGEIILKKTNILTTGTFTALDRNEASVLFFRANTTGSSTLTGIQGGKDGMILYLMVHYNLNDDGTGGSGSLFIQNESAAETNPNNRIRTGQFFDLEILGRGGAVLVYDGGLSRWIMVSVYQ